MDYERCEEERRGCINLAEHRCVSFTERYRSKPVWLSMTVSGTFIFILETSSNERFKLVY
jgi:hypothetical protein